MTEHWIRKDIGAIKTTLEKTWWVPDQLLPYCLPTAEQIAPLAVAEPATVARRDNPMPTLNRGNEKLIPVDSPPKWQRFKCFQVEDRTTKDDLARNFHYAVFRDLDTIYGKPPGTILLDTIMAACDKKGLRVVITFGNGYSQNGVAQASSEGQWDKDRGEPGTPASSHVLYNPFLFGIPWVVGFAKETPWGPSGSPSSGHPSNKPPDVTLCHELMHVSDTVRGLLRKDSVSQTPKKGKQADVCELRAVGIGPFRSANIFSENSYRDVRGLPERLGYPDDTDKGPWAEIPQLKQYLPHISLSNVPTSREDSSPSGNTLDAPVEVPKDFANGAATDASTDASTKV